MKAIVPVLEENKKKPYYLQLYNHIKRMILDGDINADEKLPSLRSLAKSTSLSITTIEQAYNQLLVEGYIYSKANSGYYVNSINAFSNSTVRTDLSISDEKVSSFEQTVTLETSKMQYDPDCFDFNKWKKCMNRVINDFSYQLHFEGDPQGELSLRNEIANYLYLSRGVECSPAQIVIGAGTQQITTQLAVLLRRQGIEHVALETPAYQPVKSAFRDRRFAITEVPSTGKGLTIEKLPANIRTAAYVSPSNNAFTGAVMPISRRYELIAWANNNDSYIIEDDYDSELRYFGRPIPSLKSLNDSERVIYLGSFSSTLFAAVKISYMVLPLSLSEEFNKIAHEYSQTCSKLEQMTLAMFMNTGYYQTHIKKLRKLYSSKLTKIADELSKQSDGFINVRNTASGINIIVDVDSNKSTEELKRDAEALGIPAIINQSAKLDSDTKSIILYYNQIPLDEISSVAAGLISSWRS